MNRSPARPTLKPSLLGTARGREGYALLGVTVLLFSMLIIGTAFMAMAGYETKATQVNVQGEQSFWLAEAGRERGLNWLDDQFRPPDFDKYIYTDEPGPERGKYTVKVWVDPNNSFTVEKNFVLESKGDVYGRERRILQSLRMNSLALYAYFTEDERTPGGNRIWFASQDRLEGPVHSNGTIHLHGTPQFLGPVSSHSDHIRAWPNFQVYDEGGFPVGGNNPNFADGLSLNAPEIPLPSETADLRQAAQTGGLLPNPSRVELGVIGNPPVPQAGWARYEDLTNPGVWNDLDLSTLPSEVIYCDGDMEIMGELDGQITVSSRGDIHIVDDVRYAASDPTTGQPLPGCDDLMGMVAERNIRFRYDPPTTDDLIVNAVLLALNTSITADEYDNMDRRGSLTIWGGLLQKYRGPVGLKNSGGNVISGYEKDYHYDTRVTARTPPQFPLTGVYEEILWEESWDNAAPF